MTWYRVHFRFGDDDKKYKANVKDTRDGGAEEIGDAEEIVKDILKEKFPEQNVILIGMMKTRKYTATEKVVVIDDDSAGSTLDDYVNTLSSTDSRYW